MAKTVGIGIQSFEKIREEDCFYIDKTDFIRQISCFIKNCLKLMTLRVNQCHLVKIYTHMVISSNIEGVTIFLFFHLTQKTKCAAAFATDVFQR